jgi:transcriptional regulator GlxA family with amidase domain
MNRRRFLAGSALLAGGAAAPIAGRAIADRGESARALPPRPISLPADGYVRTAFAIGPGVNVIDTAGPWEVFCDAAIYGGRGHFDLYTVASSTEPVEGNSGLRITPRYSYEDAPHPHVVVVPAHDATSDTVDWLRHVGGQADMVMSVCTGAFVLAQTGLLDGKTATTHHRFYDDFEAKFPKIRLVRGQRFVEHERVATAGGLTSGIDLALRLVERYLGRDGAAATARYLEYASRSTSAYNS